MKDYFLYSINNLKKRKVRSFLTIIGIFIGITAVVALLSLGQGLKEAINSEFESIGTNRIFINPGALHFGPPGTNVGTTILTDEDLEVVRKTQGTDVVLGIYIKTAKVEFKDEEKFISVMGLPLDPEQIKEMAPLPFFEIETGRFLEPGDTKEASIGDNIAFDRFEKEITSKDKIKIEGETFSVVGIHENSGIPSHDNAIKIPIDKARKLFGDTEDEISLIIVITNPNEEVSVVAQRINKNLRKERGDVDEGDEDFTVTTAEQTIQTLNTILSIVTIFLAGVAAISLIVGGIGIMTTMYTSIIERRKEIGIMKAIGATNKDIGIIFLIESGLLGIIGGVLGLLAGITIAKIAEFIAHQLGAGIFQASMNPLIFIGALLFAFIVGSLSGFAPAMQAAKLKPVDALRK